MVKTYKRSIARYERRAGAKYSRGRWCYSQSHISSAVSNIRKTRENIHHIQRRLKKQQCACAAGARSELKDIEHKLKKTLTRLR